jgi:hypothetical protein
MHVSVVGAVWMAGEETNGSLMTMTMPPWQCWPLAQYIQMGFVSLIWMV